MANRIESPGREPCRFGYVYYDRKCRKLDLSHKENYDLVYKSDWKEGLPEPYCGSGYGSGARADLPMNKTVQINGTCIKVEFDDNYIPFNITGKKGCPEGYPNEVTKKCNNGTRPTWKNAIRLPSTTHPNNYTTSESELYPFPNFWTSFLESSTIN